MLMLHDTPKHTAISHNDLHEARANLLSARDTLTQALFSPNAIEPCVFDSKQFLIKAAHALGLKLVEIKGQ